MFYNGTSKRPAKETLCLSKAFEDMEVENFENMDLGILELKVPVYNINKGMNEELFNRGKKLKQYSEFVAKLREYREVYDSFERVVKETVTYCIANDILAEFLRENGGKIMSILTMEYDIEIAKQVYAEEQIEDRNIELVKKMLQEGEPIEKIIRYAELPLEVIAKLQRQM